MDADISDFFGSLSHELLVDLVADRVADGKVLSLIRSMLTAGVLRDGVFESAVAGVPQGGVASPLLSNIYLTVFDQRMAEAGFALTRYADDCVPRTLKEDRCRRRYRRMRCCTRDEGARPMVWWPSAVALQGEAANHREVRRSRAGVLSVAEKARCQRVRCGSRRRAKAIPPLKCRKRIGDIQNRGRVIAPGRVWREPADWPGGCPA